MYDCSYKWVLQMEEYFNMKHLLARNITERCFGILKKRWAILRSPSFYPIKLQGRMVLACALLHNFIRTYMTLDREENTTQEYMPFGETSESNDDVESIDVVESSNECTQWRDDIAQEMFESWMSSRLRNWTVGEEDALILILQEIVDAGGRSDNGCFRSGTGSKVTVDAQVLDEYLKKHPSKNYIANKPFPQYERLTRIFGKDQATGSLAEPAADAMENINLESEVGADTNDFVIANGLNSLSEEVGKLVEVVGTPGLVTLNEELEKLGFDDSQCIALGMHFSNNPVQLCYWSTLADRLKQMYAQSILGKLDMV
ncbi:hypothetical protein OSB04_007199 [Centaurea solstitialis]|uniref:DDE Tnp4 domain-containing protein n=1 Tax=Centaurea solstitialis TaxID=347529 RepID=A0AA38WSG2_9ASTR|nr:hypothetical protein OSB04_007199 [Centaurea solstitialis]